MSCSVCIEKFNKVNLRAKCPNDSCNYEVCRKCIRKWLLDKDNLNDPSCANCKIAFTRESLVNMCGISWVNSIYSKHREEILFDRIKSKLPEYQDHATAYNRYLDWKYSSSGIANLCYDLRNIETLRDRLTYRYKDHYQRYTSDINYKIPAKFTEFPTILNDYMKKINDLKKESNKIQEDLKSYIKYLDSDSDTNEIESKVYITRGSCPNENCNGLIGESWKCEICNTKICKECMCNISNVDNHICRSEDIETVKLIRESSKPCPNCRARITRIEGCSQMWCTHCHVAFDYKTGQIYKDTKYFHNPHYIDFLKKNNLTNDNTNNHRVNVCGITADILSNVLYSNKATKLQNDFILEHYRKSVEIKDYYRYNNDNINQIIYDLSKQYLNNKISKKDFKTYIQRKEKDFSKKNEVMSIRNTWSDIVFDILYKLINDNQSVDITYKLLDENRNIAIKALNNISVSYNSVVPTLFIY